ncbi:hypothetical protein G5I_11189 [Acromyrmex echinatior]|uniref:Uncharacterized protein n=1 Tax=Acromyrmex echinatior TaxID=103372 RepID=F4WYX5_ACREC|nr:hypothetical protein G5I_11189 [Acromyrmex echinatior]
MYKHALSSVKPPRVRSLAFDRVARLFRTRGVRNYNRRVCTTRTYAGITGASYEVGVDEKVKAGDKERQTENRANRERWNNRKVVKRGCCGRQVEKSERAGSTEKARSGSFKPASTTRDFAMYVLCRVDTRRDILTRQTIARRVGISPGSRLKERQTRRLVLAEQAALVNNYAGSGDLQSPSARQDVNPFYDVRSKVLSPRASSLFFINNYARILEPLQVFFMRKSWNQISLEESTVEFIELSARGTETGRWFARLTRKGRRSRKGKPRIGWLSPGNRYPRTS